MEVDSLPWVSYVSIDPGLKHCCAVKIAVYNAPQPPRIIWQKTYDLSGGSQPNPDTARVCAEEIREHVTWAEKVVVEYQPPLRKGGIALVRHNCWIEGYFLGVFPSAVQIHPSACKQFWNIRSGNYRTNKALAIAKARSLVANPEVIKQDHEADCVLNALYLHHRDSKS